MSDAPALEESLNLLPSTMFMLFSASALISLLSFSPAASAADNCTQLIQPLAATELNQILGRWILIEGFGNEIYETILGNMESVWLELSTTADSNTLLLDQGNRLVPQQHPTPEKSQCLRVAFNMTFTNAKTLDLYLEVSRSYHRFLQTCPDCLLMHTYHKENTYQTLYLFGKNNTLAASDLETSRKQAACLQFPQPAQFQYDTSKELCPV